MIKDTTNLSKDFIVETGNVFKDLEKTIPNTRQAILNMIYHWSYGLDKWEIILVKNS